MVNVEIGYNLQAIT